MSSSERAPGSRELASLFKADPAFRVPDRGTAGIAAATSVAGKDEIFIGEIKAEASIPGAFWIWIVADNLTAGSALNALAVAEAPYARSPGARMKDIFRLLKLTLREKKLLILAFVSSLFVAFFTYRLRGHGPADPGQPVPDDARAPAVPAKARLMDVCLPDLSTSPRPASRASCPSSWSSSSSARDCSPSSPRSS